MPFWLLVAVALMIGGISNPLYALLLAHTNDYLDSDMMAAGLWRVVVRQWFGRDCWPAGHWSGLWV